MIYNIIIHMIKMSYFYTTKNKNVIFYIFNKQCIVLLNEYHIICNSEGVDHGSPGMLLVVVCSETIKLIL
jgi:hypothetical protein